MPTKPIVFISCGQFTSAEIDLGNAVAELIRKETPFEPYFAEQQNTLDGLTANILSNLAEAVGFVGIMHHRGEIDTPSGRITRGSVWVEQELAIAAFIQHVLGRRIEVGLYLQRGIAREGIRQQLRLKPVEFDKADDVLTDLRTRVSGWSTHISKPQPLQAEWKWEHHKPYTGERHDYRLTVELVNTGTSVVSQWLVEAWFPSLFIEDANTREPFAHFEVDDSKYSDSGKRIFPGGRLLAFQIEYFVTGQNWPGWYEGEKPTPVVRIRVTAEGQRPWEAEIPFMKLQDF